MSSTPSRGDLKSNLSKFVSLPFTEKLRTILSGFYSTIDIEQSSKTEILTLIDQAIFEQIQDEAHSYLYEHKNVSDKTKGLLDKPESRLFFSLLESIFLIVKKSSSVKDLEFEQLSRLKFCLLKASIVNPDFYIDSSNLNRQFFSEIYGGLIISQGNKDKLTLINDTISKIVLEFPGVNSTREIDELLEQVLDSFQARSKEIRNKALVLERRTCESEFGKSISWAAKFWSTRQINALIEQYQVPEFVQDILQSYWVNILYLDRLKNPEKIEYQSVLTIRYLIASLLPVFEQNEMDLVSTLQKEVVGRMYEGLKEQFDSQIKMNSFFDELKERHQSIVSELENTESPEAKADSPNIIRLSPSQTISNGANEVRSVSKKVQVSPARLEIWVEELFKKRITERASAELFSSEVKQSEKLESDLVLINEFLFPGMWYELEIGEARSVAKLSTKLDANESYVFVDSRGLKVETINEPKLASLIKQKKIKFVNEKLITESSFGQVVNKIVHSVTSRYEKQISEFHELERERKILLEQQLTEKYEREEFLKKNEKALDIARENLDTLEVGAWVKVKDEDGFKRYKIGAKLLSSKEIVLLDRNGFKVDSIEFEDFVESIVKGEIELSSDDNLFDFTLR